MGIVLLGRQQYNEAITLFNESINFKANDWTVLINRGDCYKALSRFDDAYKDFIKA